MTKKANSLEQFLSYRTELLRYATRLVGDRGEAEDVVQEAWLRFSETASSQPIDEPRGYLHRIVRNLAYDGRRSQALRARYFIENADAEAAAVSLDQPSAESRLISSEELRIVLEALEAMPERMRIAVEMHRFAGAKLKHIAARLDVSVTTAHHLVADGIERCRARLRRRPPE
ncbi:sigma-70 family RNA polymerase sigma factor [Sphingomonas gei]|uniref:sigma-70 family RNA polymerase sigma factor n=1 Tax=Sphingomonas gei TaxID=1395960 RepID=UPI0019D2EA40|nr:sigma-70 family RNA polymerase sigma factor [Sphingomonas gei]